MNGFFGFNMFSLMSMLFPVFFILIFGLFIFTIGRNIKEWNSNNKEPVLIVAAKLVSRRINNRRHHNSNGHSSNSTSYYATFEVESGDRMEFHISGKEYGLLAEGDMGKLTFQGTRYHSFERVD